MAKKKIVENDSWSHKHDYPITEIWNTGATIAALIVPRLRAFKSLDKHCYPPNMNGMTEWNGAIQKMIDDFELLSTTRSYTDEEETIITEGLDLFHQFYRDLWD